MASTVVTKYCTRCKQSGRPAAVACNGCQHLFCITCIVEHRQELVTQIDDINREHGCLQQTLSQKYDVHVLLSRIDVWEQESIAKIKVAATDARLDLQQWINRGKNQVNPLLDPMTKELESSQKLNDYPEINLKKWVEQLKELREMMDNLSNVSIVNEMDAESIIHLIKVKENLSLQKPSILVLERFDKAIGAISLSDNSLRAAHVDHIGSSGSTCGFNLYSSGIHRIRFQIQGDWGVWFFSGIMTSLQEVVAESYKSPSVYGWWDFDGPVVNGQLQKFGTSGFIVKDDELTFTLNCDMGRIELEHHRTNERVHLSVDLQVCPFPWKFLIGVDWRGGCVRLLH
jgi:hypothetical protein